MDYSRCVLRPAWVLQLGYRRATSIEYWQLLYSVVKRTPTHSANKFLIPRPSLCTD